MMTDDNKGAQLSTDEVAALAGVKPQTINGYRFHGRMPAPDGKLGKTVWWWESTIRAWLAERPGKGWRKDQADEAPSGDGTERDEDGFVLDENGRPWGHCDSCGEEAPAYSECCEDGEVVP